MMKVFSTVIFLLVYMWVVSGSYLLLLVDLENLPGTRSSDFAAYFYYPSVAIVTFSQLDVLLIIFPLLYVLTVRYLKRRINIAFIILLLLDLFPFMRVLVNIMRRMLNHEYTMGVGGSLYLVILYAKLVLAVVVVIVAFLKLRRPGYSPEFKLWIK
jgi:hypothetical protein